MPAFRGQRAVFVAGLGHSGSTLLDLMLAGHSRVVGLGEIESLLRVRTRDRDEFRATRCSCGVDVAACTFWSTVDDRLSHSDQSVSDGYRTVVDTFSELFGSDVALIDSSKNLESLRRLAETHVDVSVLNLIRDVRGWTVSMRDRNRVRLHHTPRELWRRDGWSGLSRFAGQTTVAYFRFWYRRNRDMHRAIQDQGLRMLRVGYEPLALSTADTMEAIAGWLGLPSEAGMLAPNPSASHTASGNDMRLAPDKRDAVVYDTRWLTRRGWAVPAALHPEIMRYNAEHVYGAPAPAS